MREKLPLLEHTVLHKALMSKARSGRCFICFVIFFSSFFLPLRIQIPFILKHQERIAFL